jgi:von Willebrand factor type A domain
MKKTKFLFLAISLFALFAVSCDKDVDLSTVENVFTSDDYALKIEISWDAVSDAEGYNIYRADYDYYYDDVTDLVYTKIGSTGSMFYEDFSVVSNSYYYYQVEAYSGDSKGSKSEPIMGMTTYLTTSEAFDALADYTDGLVYNATYASEVPTMINQIISNHAVTNTDLVFLIDNTGSMDDDISQVQQAIASIMASLPSGTKVGAAVYNDLNEDPTGWYDYTNLTSTYSVTSSFINEISVYGGGDLPESVYDGIVNTVGDMSWTSSSKRIMIVIGDAPPLEGDLTYYTLGEVIDECTSMGVTVNLYPILIGSYKKSGRENQ